MDSLEFTEALGRIKAATGCETQSCIAKALGVTQVAVSRMMKRRTISDRILLTLVVKYAINPDWILYGGDHLQFLRPCRE